MGKTEFAAHLATLLGTTKKDSSFLARSVFETMEFMLVEQGKFSIPKFGIFRIVETKPRKVRNPTTGAEMMVPAGRKLVFKPSKTFKDKL